MRKPIMHRHSLSRLHGVIILLAALLALPRDALAARTSYAVTAPDGTVLAVHEAGDPHGAPIVFLHGLLGSSLNWEAQLDSLALQRFRLVAFDLRGHGQSGKPAGAAPYRDARRWADDLAAVLRAAQVRKPVLVGWSLGGAVISAYLAAYGDQDIAGAVYAGGVIELAPGQIAAHPAVYRDIVSPDLRTHLDAMRSFLRLCFEKQPDAATFERLLANAAMASWDMQSAVQSMTVPAAEALTRMRKPMLLVYGERDALVQARASAARAMALNPRIRSSFYPDVGHAPFLEERARFEQELAAFAESVQRP